MKVFALFLISITAYAVPITHNVASLKPNSCQLFLHCNDEINPLWHKYQLNSDLADLVVKDVLENSKLETSNAKVALATTGLDSKISRKLFNNVEVFKGTEDAGDPNIDLTGEGSAMTGMISLKTLGLTNYVDVKTLRVNPKNYTYARSDKTFEIIKKACDIADIVTLEISSHEISSTHDKLLEKNWYRYAYNHGCLLITEFGTFSSGETGLNLPVYSPLITVSSKDEVGDRSDNSINAMISVPATFAYSMLSSRSHLSRLSYDKACSVNNIPMEINIRHRIASAEVASVAGQVITILKARQIYPKNPKEKISLVKKILLAASQYEKLLGVYENNLNAYIATLIAKNIEKKDFSKDVNELHYVLSTEKNKICNQPINCEQKNDCTDQYQCVNELRKVTAICQESVLENSMKLILSLKNMNEKRLAYFYTTKRFKYSIGLERNDEATKSFQKNYLVNIWNHRAKNKFKIYFLGPMIDVMSYAHKLGLKELYNLENFSEIYLKKAFFEFDIYDPELKDQSLSKRLENGKKLHDLYLTFSSQERAEIVKELWAEYKKGNVSGFELKLIQQFYSAEGITTEVGNELKNLIIQVTKHSLKLIPTKFSIELKEFDYEYILFKFPEIKEEIKSKIKAPYIFVNKEVLNLALEHPETFLTKSEEQIATTMLYEIFERRVELQEEIKLAKTSMVEGGEVLKAFKEHSFFIIRNILGSKKRNPELVTLIDYLIFQKVPLYSGMNTIIPSHKVDCSYTPNKCLLLNGHEFLNSYIEHLFSQLNGSMNLDEYVATHTYGYHAMNINHLITYSYEYLNKNEANISIDLKQQILSSMDLAIEKMLLVKKSPKHPGSFENGMNYQAYYKWTASAKIARNMIEEFIEMSRKFEKVTALKDLGPAFKQKIVLIYDYFQKGELDLEEETLFDIKRYLNLEE